MTETVDANSNVTRYAYDAANRITAVTDALGNQRAYTYNPGGKIMAIRDFDGNEAGFTYNPLGKVETYTDKEGQTVHFTYDKMWNISSVTAPDQGRQEYIYDSNNRLVKQTLPMGGVVTYAYDAAGNRTEMTDPAGNTTRYCYDAVNRLTEVLEADGAKTAYEYDREGNLIKETNAAGQVTSYTYDDLGRRTSVTNPAGATTSVFYNELGKAERICYPNGSSTVYEYEKGGRLKSVRYPDGAGEHYGYDAKGNLTERTTTAGESYRYNYDSLDRMISVQNPAGGISHFTYDALGRVIKAENENGNQTCYEYTPNGNLAKVTDAMGNEAFYQYDAMGHLTQSSCTGAEGEEPQNTVYTWNKEGHVTAVTDPLGDVECYTYDPAGRMKAKIDKDGYETSFHYGKDGQVEEICYADGRTVSLTYNAIRQLEEVRDWLGTTKIAMDEAGRIASVTDPYGKTVGYEWGSMGERTAICYPDGRRTAYEYNEAMQLSALKLLSDDAQEKTILYSYDEAGRLTGKQFPGGNRTDYSYNGAGKIKEILHTGADFTERYHYDYDVMGNKVLAEKERPGLPEDSGNFSYDYDALNRLTSVACNGKTLRTYGYDAFGNRNTRTEYQAAGELVTTYHYNTKNQLMQETNAGGTRNYNYDHRGNLLSVTSGEEVLKAYGFDAANRMSSSVDRTAGEITKAYYQYNGLGHRVGQTIASGNADVTQTIRYTLDLTRQYHNLLQKTGNGLDQTYFWDGNVAGMEENGRDHFYFQDDLGSPMRLADEDGRSEEVYGFDEFGNDIRTAKDIFKDSLQSFGFTGYQMDSVGVLYFAQARRYDAGVGRFISEDFIKGHIAAPYTMNHYNYCWNRPLDLVDLNGMEPTAGVIKALMDMLKCDETVSYIFYTTGENSDFTDQANWKKEQLESEGKNVVMIPIANANDFVDGWNHMGMTPDGIANIEDVEIYTHSNETTFIFIDNTETEALSISGKNKSGKAIKGISDLSYKEIETLNIYGCNSGNLSTYFRYDANIASELSKIVSGDVYAYDGNVGFGPTWTRPFSKYGEYEDRLSNIQKSYIKISLKNGWLNEPMGKLRYKEGKLDGKCDE